MSRKPRPQPRARAAVVHLPRRPTAGARGSAPTGRSVVAGLVLAAVAALAYVAARETPVFAVRTIQVEGASPDLARRVHTALQPLEGESLLKLRAGEVARLATELPRVAGVSYDRSFPNTLVVRVESEQPLAVVRRGSGSWLVSRRGRVIGAIARGRFRGLPRIWLPQKVEIVLGATLGRGGGAEEVAALAPLRAAGLGGRVTTVRIDGGQVTYALRGGLALHVGSMDGLALKLAVARRILAGGGLSGYLDVSVPERPVAGTNPQVSG